MAIYKAERSANNAGGSANNAGVDYQHRIAGYLMVYLMLRLDVSSTFGLYNLSKISEISFETSNKIDDIRLTLSAEKIIFIQAKRKVSLSSSKGSSFYSTIQQFVEEYRLNSNTLNTNYVLATSSESSSKVIRELRKIIESIKANDSGFEDNPLNKSEQATLSRFRSILQKCYRSCFHKKMQEDDFIRFTKKISILVVDIESKMSLEKSILLILASQTQVNPDLIWKAFISYALELSLSRLSINWNGIHDKFGKFFIDPSTSNSQNKDLGLDEKIQLLNMTVTSINEISSGREILLIESPEDIEKGDEYLVVEMIRFKDDCSKKHYFDKDKCFISDDIFWKVIIRASTYAGLNRELELGLSFLQGKTVRLAPLQLEEEEDPDASLCATLHSELCLKHLKENNNDNCLHCQKSILGDSPLLVEVDEVNSIHAIGCIHCECLLPSDRIIGSVESDVFKDYSHLKKFDLQRWSESIKTGQCRFEELKSSGINNNIIDLIWSSDCEYNSTYSFCVQITLNDGNTWYIRDRGKIHRMNLIEAQETVELINNRILEYSDKDPICFTSKRFIEGPYSELLRVKGNDEKCIESKSAEVVRYNNVLTKVFDHYTNYYAPVFVLLDQETELPFELNNSIFIMTDPMELESFNS